MPAGNRPWGPGEFALRRLAREDYDTIRAAQLASALGAAPLRPGRRHRPHRGAAAEHLLDAP